MNIGAGRVVMQDLPLIDQAAADGSLARNERLAGLIDALKDSGGRCHLMGLLSPGGVHSHQDHMAALANTIADAGIDVVIHGFLDGRDTPPSSAKAFVETLLADVAGSGRVRIGTIGGRYYAMDRDKRWDRVELAYDCLVDGAGETATGAIAAIEQSYANDATDEFVLPTAIEGLHRHGRRRRHPDGQLPGRPGAGDFDGPGRSLLRRVRARAHRRLRRPPGNDRIFDRGVNEFLEALFPQRPLANILGEIVANQGMTQLRIAETEKYAHVTFFFNGGEEKMFDGEERILVPSPKVATYDLQPEMSAPEVTDKLVTEIAAGKFDLIVVNYANGDMVGHTGVFDATVKAAETIDTCLGRLEEAVTAAGGTMLITADHGNAERMFDHETGQPHTAHTTLPVPFIMVRPPAGAGAPRDGVLADIAPTILALMGLAQPAEMTGTSLVDMADAPETHAAE